MKPFRFGVSFRVFAGLAVMGLLFIGASVVAVQSFNELNRGLRSFSTQDLPTALAGSKLNQLSANLASFAPALIAADSPGTRKSIFLRIKDQVAWLDEILESLEQSEGASHNLQQFRSLKDNLVTNLERIADLVKQRNEVLKRSAALLQKIPRLNLKSFKISNQLLLAENNQPSIRNIQDWHQLNTEALFLIPIAASMNHPMELAEISKRFSHVHQQIIFLTMKLPDHVQAEFISYEKELRALGQMDEGIIPLRAKSLELNNQVQGTLSQNKVIADRFVASSSSLTRKIRKEILNEIDRLDQSTQERSLYFIIITFLCISGAALVFIYINKSVILRLSGLQKNMLSHADGRGKNIVTSGHDEIADMAKAFKFFVETIREREEALQTANRQVAEVQNRLLDAIQNISEGFVLFDAQRKIVLCNDNYRQLYGYQNKDVLSGTTFEALLQRDLDRGLSLDMNAYRNARKAQFEKQQEAIELQLADGRWLSIQDCPTTEGGVVGIHVDITEKKEIEKALLKAKEIAERADRAKSRFLAAASHDLRQPLHAVGLFVAELMDRTQDPEVQDTVENIERSIFHMNDLFESILDFSLLEADDLHPETSAISLAPILKNIAREFKPQAVEKGLDFRVVISNEVILSDSLMLNRILRNFVSNAIRYTVKGRVLMGVRRQRNFLRIEVWDTGVGILPEQQELIFSDFYRGGETRTQDRGLGLGLSIATQMATLLDTTINLQSWPGQGSCFNILMPLGVKGSGVLTADAGPIQSSGKPLIGELVMVVDDDPQILKASKKLLQRWGCKVVVSQDFDDAEIKLKECGDKVLAILMDYQISTQESGLDFLKRLTIDKNKGIIISGNTNPEIALSVKAAGYPFFKKPLSPVMLATRLRHLKRNKI